MGQFLIGGSGGGGSVVSVSGTAPVQSSGGTTPVISMHQADASNNGWLSSADWITFNAAGIGDMTKAVYDPANLSSQITVKTIHISLAQAQAGGLIEGQWYQVDISSISPVFPTMYTFGLSSGYLSTKAFGDGGGSQLNTIGITVDNLFNSIISIDDGQKNTKVSEDSLNSTITPGNCAALYGDALDAENSNIDNCTIAGTVPGAVAITLKNVSARGAAINTNGFTGCKVGSTLLGAELKPNSVLNFTDNNQTFTGSLGEGSSYTLTIGSVTNQATVGANSIVIGAMTSLSGATILASLSSSPITVNLSAIQSSENCLYEKSHNADPNFTNSETNLPFRKDIFPYNKVQVSADKNIAIGDGTGNPAMFVVDVYANTHDSDPTAGIVNVTVEYSDETGPQAYTIGAIDLADASGKLIYTNPIYSNGTVSLIAMNSGGYAAGTYDLFIICTRKELI